MDMVIADPNPASVGTPISLTATIDDSDTGDSSIAAAEYSIDNGSLIAMNAQDGDFDEVSENVVVTVPSFLVADVHKICILGTDAADNIGLEDCIFLAVFDPDGGFVTGGGWINSPAGAYVPDPLLTGKANFGFVSKYKKGATLPTGQTQFHFKAGNLNFHSDVYQWLVVAGPHAKFKGTGTINGSGNYGFMVTATDGQINGGGGIDGFRVKIWDKEDGDTVVYDNKIGESDDSNASTALGGGSIKIHKK